MKALICDRLRISHTVRVTVSIFLLCLFPGKIAHLKADDKISNGQEAPKDKYHTYTAYRTDEAMKIDGKLEENAWKNTPSTYVFGNLRNGMTPPHSTKAKILWDDKNLYIGYYIEDPNVWGRCRLRDMRMHALEPSEGFAKLYIDPDCDYKKYIEIHVSPLNNIRDIWFNTPNVPAPPTISKKYNLPSSEVPYRQNLHEDWNCPGIKTAVSVDGTINDDRDLDKGWCVEIAIPFSSLKQFAGNTPCPPLNGDTWRMHLARRYRPSPQSEKVNYYGWPHTGKSCHNLHNWGYVTFCKKTYPEIGSEKMKKYLSDKELRWKCVWAGIGNVSKPEIKNLIDKAKMLGFNAIVAKTKYTSFFIRECRNKGLETYMPIAFVCRDKKFAQKMQAGEENLPCAIKQKASYQRGGMPIENEFGKERLQAMLYCFRQPAAFEYAKKKIREAIKLGYDGVAFDFIGYQNYYGCYCDTCNRAREEYKKTRPGIPEKEAEFHFNEQELVDFYKKLVDYVKKENPKIKTTCHVHPVFLPNPLYGNKLPVDYCAQTVAWCMKPHWPYEKIRNSTDVVVREQGKYHPKSIGVPFINIHGKTSLKDHMKTPERLSKEIQIIKDSGSEGIMIFQLKRILSSDDYMKVVKNKLN